MFDLGDMDVVLGMQWIQEIKEFCLCVSPMQIRFEYQGREYVLSGLVEGSLRTMSFCAIDRVDSRRHESIQVEPITHHVSQSSPFYGSDQ